MRDWLKLAEEMDDGRGLGADRSERVEKGPEDQIRSIHPIHLKGLALSASPSRLPPNIVTGLGRLTYMPAPRLANPDAWPRVVEDALWLAQSGHAEAALSLGWTELQLFGWAPTAWPQIDLDYHGLATHIEGRRVMLLEAERAWIGEPPFRSCIRRDLMEVKRFLWEGAR